MGNETTPRDASLLMMRREALRPHRSVCVRSPLRTAVFFPAASFSAASMSPHLGAPPFPSSSGRSFISSRNVKKRVPWGID